MPIRGHPSKYTSRTARLSESQPVPAKRVLGLYSLSFSREHLDIGADHADHAMYGQQRDRYAGAVPELKALAAERWFGYGRWAAPYWFVGMEPGGEDDARVYETWHELGAPELLDLKDHSEKCEEMRWLGEHPPLQATWKQLIRMALGYEEAPSDTEDVRRYQRDRLGRSDADTLLIELSAVNAPSLSAHVAERESHRAERIATIRRRMEENRPTFVVFYGVGYRGEYEKVVGAPFDGDGYRWHGTTLCALVRHPAARSSSPASWWSAKGDEMRRMRLSNIG